VFSQSPVGLHVIGTDLRVLRVNKVACGMRGAPESQILGRPVREVYAGFDPQAVERAVLDVLATGTPIFDLMVRGVPPADPGHEHVFATTLFRLDGVGGHIMGVVAWAVDVTTRERTRERLALLHRAHERIGRSLDPVQCARELVDVAVPALAGSAFVALFDAALYREDPAVHPDLRCVAAVSTFGDAPAAGAPLDPGPFATVLAHRTPRVDHRSPQGPTLSVPMVVRDTALGVLCLQFPDRLHPFDEPGVRLTADIAAHTALCIDNAQRYEHAHATALALHGSHPRPAPVGHQAVETAQRYLPTGHGAGAWFDVIPLSGARVALMVGQVHGEGLQATAAMGQLRSATHALSTLDLDPHDLLARLHDTAQQLRAERLTVGTSQALAASCTYAVYDPVSTRCAVARAGRQSLLIGRPDGTWNNSPLDDASPLGADGPPFAADEFTLPPGSTLALLSGPDPADPHTMDRLRARLDSRTAEPAQEDLDDLPSDQAAVLLARTRRLDPDNVATWDVPADVTAVADARQRTTDRLRRWGLDRSAFAAELTVSELVTNAIRHGAPPIRLRLVRNTTSRSLTCEVSDASPAAPHLRHARAGDEGGRGLFIAGQLSDTWGVRWSEDGKTVWTESAFGL
jgi:PAS domain S-box-containing protein